MASIPITVDYESAPGTPLVTPVDLPTIRIRRIDTQALVVTDLAMTEVGDGIFVFNFTPPVEGIEYAARSDGDPNATGQVPGRARYRYGNVDDFGKEVWQARGLDPANPKTTTENTADTDYTESVDAAQVQHVKVGAVTTATRT